MMLERDIEYSSAQDWSVIYIFCIIWKYEYVLTLSFFPFLRSQFELLEKIVTKRGSTWRIK